MRKPPPRLLDWLVLQRLAVVGLRQHLALVAFWIMVGLGYNLLVLMRQGTLTGDHMNLYKSMAIPYIYVYIQISIQSIYQ